MYYIIILAVVVVDQAVKALVVRGMSLHQSIPLLDGVFHLTYIHNTGAAFSIFQGKTALLIALPLLVTLLIMGYIFVKRKSENSVLLMALSLIAAGGIGNIIDRVRLGYVVDMFDFRIWPIFNVADVAVCCGCGLLIVYVLLIEPKLNKKGASDETAL